VELRDAGPLALALRRAKLGLVQARRVARWIREPAAFAPPARTTPSGPIVYQRRIPIARTGADARLEAGKRHNVRLAATAFHGVAIAPDHPLSFWRTLGAATAARGFSWGMELRSGCAVPAIGGGLCLVSNALFAIAMELGWQILERHGHSLALADPGALDATVAFPHVDLRIAPRSGTASLAMAVHGDVLVVAVHHDAPLPQVELERSQREHGGTRDTQIRRRVWADGALVEDRVVVADRQRIPYVLRTCLDCGETACDARVELPEHVR
jgi:vancomycin resistance protein VanW